MARARKIVVTFCTRQESSSRPKYQPVVMLTPTRKYHIHSPSTSGKNVNHKSLRTEIALNFCAGESRKVFLLLIFPHSLLLFCCCCCFVRRIWGICVKPDDGFMQPSYRSIPSHYDPMLVTHIYECKKLTRAELGMIKKVPSLAQIEP
jgi:hypothetical protein